MTRREFLIAGGLLPAIASADVKGRIGCQTSAWKLGVPEFRDLLPVLETIKKLGFDGFETGYRNVQGQFENLKEAQQLLQGTGLKFFGCHIFQFEYDPKTNIPEFSLISRIARGVSELGAERLIVSGSPAGKDIERLRWKSGALNRAGRLCRDLRVKRLCYHNHGEEFDFDAIEMRTLLKETDPDYVRFVLDCGDAMRRKVDVAAFFAKYHKRFDALHLRDFKGDVQTSLGQGDFDYAPLAAAVKKAGWDGWVLCEEDRESGEKPGEAAVAPAREQIRKLFGA
jgi:sugar phosphate isomerase/epimerase